LTFRERLIISVLNGCAKFQPIDSLIADAFRIADMVIAKLKEEEKTKGS
jgi:hypothetical protein